MIRAVVWKEFREQGLIGLALLVLGAGVLAAAAAFADPPTDNAPATDVLRYLGAGRLAALMLAVTAGTVCGGALFAAEREAGTIGFLEALPVSRSRLWGAKVLAGALLAVGQVAVVLGVAAALGLLGGRGWAAAIASDALLAFCWGAFGSTMARTTLGSVGVAVPFAAVASFVFLVPVVVLFSGPGSGLPRQEGTAFFVALMLGTPLIASRAVFTRADRAGGRDDAPPPRAAARAGGTPTPPAPPRSVRWLAGPRAVAWLAVRRLLGPGAVMTAFALFFGLTLLSPTVLPVLYWPPLALLAGVLAGVLAFVDEQNGGACRFWAEGRLPVGRLWGVKVGVHALFALWLLFVLALPMVVRAELLPPASTYRAQSFLGTAFRTRLFDELQNQGWKYLLLPAGYGFAAGQLAGLLFRKAVVAAGVAGIVGGTMAAVWLPSVLSGGLGHGPAWVPAAALLLTGRLAVRAWTAERLATRRPMWRLAVGGLAAAAALAAGVGWRVVEVPDRPDAEADEAFVNALPGFDANFGGREFRAAAERFARAYAAATGDAGGPNTVTPDPARRPGRPPGPEALLDFVLVRGWPAPTDASDRWAQPAPAAAVLAAAPAAVAAVPALDHARLAADHDRWTDALFDRETPADPDPLWHRQAAAAAALPTGVYLNPGMIAVSTGQPALDHARLMATAALARGLQRQARGDPAAFPEALATALSLAKTLRFGSIVASFQAGNAVERAAQLATDRWLERLRGRPDLLRTVLALWRAADAGDDFDPTPYFLAERKVLRERATSPSQWLAEFLAFPGTDKESVAPEVDAVAVAWSVPWERERLRRLLGLGYESSPRGTGYELVRGRPGAVHFTTGAVAPARLTEIARRSRVGRREEALKVALALYETETGRPAAALAALVPAYLPAVPADPYADGKPLQYRLSAGEQLEVLGGRAGRNQGPVVRFQDVPAGQGVVWSVGPDPRFADGRRILAANDPLRVYDEEFVTLVPPRPKP